MSRQRCFIFRLPNETIRNIIDEVANPLRLTFVSKLMKALATPVAYRRISLHHKWSVSQHRIPAIRLLLRTLLEQPPLAQLIHHIHIQYHEFYPQNPIPEDLAQLIEASHGLPEEVRSGLTENIMGALLFLLLHRLPNLISMEINPLQCLDDIFFQQVLQGPIPSGLLSLRTISLSFSHISHRVAIPPFIPLPNLSVIKCVNLFRPQGDLGDNNEGLMVLAEPSRLQHIHLEHSDADEAFLEALFTTSEGLRSVILRDIIMPSPADHTVSPLGDALRNFSETTLRTFVLSFDCHDPYSRPFGSLRNFSHLEVISCPIANLLGPISHPHTYDLRTVLPPSLVSLSLIIDQGWWDAGCATILVQLADDKQRVVPLLQKLHLDGFMGLAEHQIVLNACEAAQVLLTYTPVWSRLPALDLMHVSPLSSPTPSLEQEPSSILEELEDMSLI